MTKLGQHFLKNRSAVKKIIETLDLKSGDTIIEIGPGEGALTFPLLEASKKIGAKVIAIEKDQLLVNWLVSCLGKQGTTKIIHGDALTEIPKIIDQVTNHQATSYKLVGNIPYYITGHLLRIISELENKPVLSVLMVQQEVAERICAKPPKMNLLAAATQIWAEPRIIARLTPEDFDPPPKVDSSVIRLLTRKGGLVANHQSLVAYYRLVKALFKQPRKTAANNLSDGLKIDKSGAVKLIKSVGLPENARPQDFSLEQLIRITNSFRIYE